MKTVLIELQRLLPALPPEEGCARIVDSLRPASERRVTENSREIERFASYLVAQLPETAARVEGTLSASPGPALLRAYLHELHGDHEGAMRAFLPLGEATDSDLACLGMLGALRNAVADEQWNLALSYLRDLSLIPCPHTLVQIAAGLVETIRISGVVTYKRQCRLAVLGNITFWFWAQVLEVYALAAGIELTLHLGSLNQYRMEIGGEASQLPDFQPDVVVLACTTEELGLPEYEEGGKTSELLAMEWAQLWDRCRERYDSLVVQCNFEVPSDSAYGSLSTTLPGGKSRRVRSLNLALAAEAEKRKGVVVLDLDHLAGEIGRDRWNDRARWYAARQYPSPAATPELCRHLMALIKAHMGLSAKCLVTDLDGTLWGGVIAEDGIGGISLDHLGKGEPFIVLQRHIKALCDRGIVLAVCSKNNEADARLPFASHPEMVLRWSDIAAHRTNWEPKAANLRAIAESLNLGLDSIVFLDDNPVERSLVRSALPEVAVLPLHTEASYYTRVLARSLCFEAITLTEEDRKRAGSYAARAILIASPGEGNQDQVLQGLGMKVELRPITAVEVPRVAQMMLKTNQFNLSGRRRTETQITELASSREWYTQCLRVKDAYADHGLTGVLLARRERGCLFVDTWLMSCRVLGRRLHEVMYAALAEYGLQTGCHFLRFEYVRTDRNQAMLDTLQKLELHPEADVGQHQWYSAALPGSFSMPSFCRVSDSTQWQASAQKATGS